MRMRPSIIKIIDEHSDFSVVVLVSFLRQYQRWGGKTKSQCRDSKKIFHALTSPGVGSVLLSRRRPRPVEAAEAAEIRLKRYLGSMPLPAWGLAAVVLATDTCREGYGLGAHAAVGFLSGQTRFP